MGRDAADSEDDLRLTWNESMNCYHIQNSQITYVLVRTSFALGGIESGFVDNDMDQSKCSWMERA